MSDRDAHMLCFRRRLVKPDRNTWVKCTLILEEVGNAVRPHVIRTFQKLYRDSGYISTSRGIIHYFFPSVHCGHLTHSSNHLWHTCFDCIANRHRVLGDTVCHHLKRNKDGWYLTTHGLIHCSCQSGFDRLQELLKTTAKANWNNVRFPEVLENSWQAAKIFMPRGNESSNDPEKVEAIALLTVMNTCSLFKVEKADIIDEVCRMRNVLMHSADHAMGQDGAEKFFNSMIKCLEMLTKEYPCDSNIKELQKIKDKEITADMFDKAIASQVQDLLNEISERIHAGEDFSQLRLSLQSAIMAQGEEKVSEKYEEAILKLKKEISELKQTNTDLKSKLDNMSELRITQERLTEENHDLKMQLQEKANIITEMTARMNDLKVNLKEEQEEKKSLRKEIHSLKEKMLNLKHDLDKLGNENTDLKEEIERLKEDLGELRHENKDLKATLKEQQEEMQALKDDLDELRNEYMSLLKSTESRNAFIERHMHRHLATINLHRGRPQYERSAIWRTS